MEKISLRGPADILAILPYQFGFRLARSAVVVAMNGRRLGFSQRLDLPPDAHVREVAEQVVALVRREAPELVLLIGYEDDDGEARPILDALADACLRSEVTVLDRLLVRGSRWWSLDCDGRCCPPDGALLAEPSRVPAVADFVAMEAAALPGREDLRDSVAPSPGDQGAEVLASVARLAASTARSRAASKGRHRAVELWAQVLAWEGDRMPLEALSADDVARLGCSLLDREWRDALIAWVCPGDLPLDHLPLVTRKTLERHLTRPPWGREGDGPAAEAVIALNRLVSRLQYLCRRLPADGGHVTAAMLTLTATLSWWRGDGALARICLERALQVEPDYRLADLLSTMVELAIRTRGASQWAGSAQLRIVRPESA